jgi:hypothetical protein
MGLRVHTESKCGVSTESLRSHQGATPEAIRSRRRAYEYYMQRRY